MWLSRNFKQRDTNTAESGVITLSDENCTEANSSTPSRNAVCYAPYGYSYKLPVGETVLIVNGASGTAVAGAKVEPSGLAQGEIELRSLGGAHIVLKNDGSVEINGLVIDKNGEIQKE